MLFNIYTKSLGEVIRGLGAECHQAAGDTQLCPLSGPAEAMQVLSQYLEAVTGWMRGNNLKVNLDKREALWFGGSQIQEWGRSFLDGVALPLKKQVRSLGALLDSSLSLDVQVTSLVQGAWRASTGPHQIQPFLDRNNLTIPW